MPKIKTHKTAAKRFKATKTGKIRRRRAMQAHKLSKKSSNRKRSFRKSQNVTGADLNRVRKMIGV
ncbi:50S ribosomal protein L35 [Patescibacteria group bacterium]|nr:50S ribosomal protein L35 [Patescibacteria group bacterium]